MTESSSDRWAIHIDFEGFSRLYDQEDQVLLSLGQLMEGIFKIGSICFPESPDRLFAHQLGDGFIIVSEFPAENLDRPIAIATALLRHVAQTGRFAKGAVAEGQFADIRSCYPTSVLAAANGSHVALGGGIMTLFPVMGTALIRAFAVAKKCPSGPLLAVPSAVRHRVPSGLSLHDVTPSGLVLVDWLHSKNHLADSLAREAGLNTPTVASLEGLLRTYCCEQAPPEKWLCGVHSYLGVSVRGGLPTKA